MSGQGTIQHFADIAEKQGAHAGSVIVRVTIADGEQAEGVAVNQGH